MTTFTMAVICIIISTGVIPVTVRPPNIHNLSTTLPTVRTVIEVSKAVAVLSTALIVRLLKSKVRSKLLALRHRCCFYLCWPKVEARVCHMLCLGIRVSSG
jgi:hypothetical protein